MERSFLPYAKQSITESDIQSVAEVMHSPIITRGPKVQEFERAIAEYCGAQYAVAFNNGTTALMAAYFAAKLTPFDRIISTPNSFIASVGQPIQIGNVPIFLDIDCATAAFDPEKLKEHLPFQSSRGRLIVVPVHFAGLAMDIQKISKMLYSAPDAMIIEDAAHALGSYYPTGERVGSCAWSHMTIFSFHPAKIITTGEGGMVTTNDPDLYQRLQLFRNNGIVREGPLLEKKSAPGYYEVHAITGNFNFTEFQAALGLSQFQRMEKFVKKRRQLMSCYRRELSNIPTIKLMTDAFDEITAFHLCVVQIDFNKLNVTREKLMGDLVKKGIGTQIHYVPIYRHPVYRSKQGDNSDRFPNMEDYYSKALSFPLYYELEEGDVKYVCTELKKLLGG